MNVQPRLAVQYYGIEQENKLLEKEHKGGWKDIPFHELLELLEGELEELRHAINEYLQKSDERKFRIREKEFHAELDVLSRDVVRESADCGNYAMMIADKVMGWTLDRGTKPSCYTHECAGCPAGRVQI